MNFTLLDATPPVNTTSDAYSPALEPVIIILCIWLVISIIHSICSWATPFHISAIRSNQDKTIKLMEQQLKLEQQKLKIENQRLQLEIEKLNLERAKQNLPPYIPKSINSKPTATPEPKQEKPAV